LCALRVSGLTRLKNKLRILQRRMLLKRVEMEMQGLKNLLLRKLLKKRQQKRKKRKSQLTQNLRWRNHASQDV
jgi:hypothetical protein